jgi:hypothetical protein
MGTGVPIQFDMNINITVLCDQICMDRSEVRIS